ncbi:hypothetical protein C5P14_24315, partial [Escherichia coli]
MLPGGRISRSIGIKFECRASLCFLASSGYPPPRTRHGRTGTSAGGIWRHCCKVSDEAAFCLIQRPYISKTLLTRRISPRG